MPDFEYIDSLGCYCHFGNAGFDRMVESRREVWFGSDGSGLLRSEFVRSAFFNDDQRARWEATEWGARGDSAQPGIDLFAPRCWDGPRRQLAEISRDGSVREVLERRQPLSLKRLKELTGEALVPEPLRRILFDLCTGLEDAEVSDDARDQLGRRGVSIARAEGRKREELIFNADTLELLGSRETLIDENAGYAPAGAIVGWNCIVNRQLVDALPDHIPPVPGPPCDPPGAGRGTPVRPDFILSTGYFTDLRAHADQWLEDGVISENDRSVLYAQQNETDRIREDRSRRQPSS